MSEREALLSAIRTAPEDDDLRLIYADWLDDHGEHDRAEVIRLEIECGRVSPGDPRREELCKRANALWYAHQEEWLGPVDLAQDDATTERGFVVEFAGGANMFVHHGDDLLRREPLLRSAYLFECDEVAEELAAWPGLGRFAELAFSFDSDDAAGVVLANPHLHGVRTLYLCDTPFGLAGFRAVANNPALGNLKKLFAEKVGLPEGAGAVLRGARHQTGLVELALPNNHLGGADLAALADGPQLGGLTSLHLSGNPLTDDGLVALARSRFLPGLTALNVSYSHISDHGLAALAGSPVRAGLRRLMVGSAGITVEGLETLAGSSYLNALECLWITHTHLSGGGPEVLVRCSGLKGLREFRCMYGNLTAADVTVLVRWPGLLNLETLDLTGNPLGDAGVRTLLDSCPLLPELRRLHLYRCGIQDEGAIALADSEKLTALEELSLPNNGIGIQGARALLDSPRRGRLRRLPFDSNPIPWELRKELRQRFPD